MADYLPNSDALMRSSLRDTIRRLRRIRVRAGCEDDAAAPPTTGDSFQDAANAFVRTVERVKVAIAERNESTRKHGQDRLAIEQSNDIRKDIRQLELLLQEMAKLVAEAEAALAKEQRRRKPRARKVQLLGKLVDERQTQRGNCVATLDVVKELDAERVVVAKGEIDAAKELQLGKRAQLREQLAGMRRRGGDGADAGNVAYVDTTVGGGRLDQHAETAAQMKVIAQQDAKIDAGLDRIKEGVGRLRQLAQNIGAELSMQNEMLDKTEHTMDRQTRQLRGINRRLARVMRDSKPLNCFFNVCCCILILALIGFFLVQFNVI